MIKTCPVEHLQLLLSQLTIAEKLVKEIGYCSFNRFYNHIIVFEQTEDGLAARDLIIEKLTED